MGIPSPRRDRSVRWGARRSTVKSVPIKDVPTPRTLERKTMHKESVANLFSELKLNPGPFCLYHVKSAQKDWKLRAAALQSAEARKICRNLKNRKQLVKRFTLNAGFSDIFKRTERSKADEEHRFSLETALSYSPVELVAHNLIDKVANEYQKKRHGVWSQLGRPYSCLGMPALSLPKEHPDPRDLEHFMSEDMFSSFFMSTTKPPVRKVSIAGTGPALIKKSDLLVGGSRSHMNLQCLLLKMGLSHLHDEAHTRFPREPLEVSDQLRKSVKVNTPFSLVMDENDPQCPSSASGQKAVQLADFRGSSLQRLGVSTTQADGPPQGSPSAENAHPPRDSTQALELPKIGQEVFEWTKEFVTLRKDLQDKLKQKLLARSIRREQCRSCPPFSAEVSSKLLVHMRESCRSQSPILTLNMWRQAEENQSQKRPTSAPLLPEVESIANFYERVCLFVSNQRDDDPLMEVLVHHLKELLERGFKLQKDLLSALCYHMAHLPDNVLCTGRMSSVMPILYFVCKELRVSSADYYMLLRNSGLDRFHGGGKNLMSTQSSQP
ncbi:hypothetical protein KP509_11G064900 [Ceratopteris richardii]|uniref:Uncharacterized protein n=1 Tax=Ceratopteris richardii TaxID=49495 RepID=A0A8T2TTQ1_CERRI|nr:hypothetical protein KP509_11G064900 [Ceratopteris richardii]